jgi:N-sulfoglucosamine sulfohydrolase
LYDLRTDPDETINVADDPAYAEQKSALGARLIKILTEAKDPRVIADPVPFEHPPFTSPVRVGNTPVKKAKP